MKEEVEEVEDEQNKQTNKPFVGCEWPYLVGISEFQVFNDYMLGVVNRRSTCFTDLYKASIFVPVVLIGRGGSTIPVDYWLFTIGSKYSRDDYWIVRCASYV